MAKYLVIFKDLVDDIDVNGFKIMTEKEVNEYEELAQSITWSFKYPLGDTDITFIDGEDLLSKLEYKDISNDEAKVFKKLFDSEFGTFIDEDYLVDIVADEESDSTYDEGNDDEEGLPLYDDDDNDY
jgi:hypothetical protein